MKHGAVRDSIKQNMFCLVNWIQRIRDECTGLYRLYKLFSFITDSILELMGEFLEDHEAWAKAGAAILQ